jgi:hypothetical protein
MFSNKEHQDAIRPIAYKDICYDEKNLTSEAFVSTHLLRLGSERSATFEAEMGSQSAEASEDQKAPKKAITQIGSYPAIRCSH